jgi:Zn-dependent protease
MIPLGSFKGVPIYGHSLFWAVFIWLSITISPLIIALVVFSILAHEFAHVSMGKRKGIETKEVILLPIGAVASMKINPSNGLDEFWIAVAGPFRSLVIAGLFMAVAFGVGGEILIEAPYTGVSEVAFLLGIINLALGLFNLIPALPMDGGRMLRSALANKFGVLKATGYASNVALVLSAVGGGLALFYGEWFSFLIAVFIFVSAQGEMNAVMKEKKREMTVQLVDFVLTDETASEEVRKEAKMIDKIINPASDKKITLLRTNPSKYLTSMIFFAVIWSILVNAIFGVVGWEAEGILYGVEIFLTIVCVLGTMRLVVPHLSEEVRVNEVEVDYDTLITEMMAQQEKRKNNEQK